MTQEIKIYPRITEFDHNFIAWFCKRHRVSEFSARVMVNDMLEIAARENDTAAMGRIIARCSKKAA